MQSPAPLAQRAPAPGGEAANKPGELLIRSSAELAQYMATGGLLAQILTQERPQLALLAEGIRWHKPEESFAQLAKLAAAGKTPGLLDAGDCAVPAEHVTLASKLMWPWLLKSGFLSADVMSDEWKLAAGVCILAAPMVPAMWKFATYRPAAEIEPAAKPENP